MDISRLDKTSIFGIALMMRLHHYGNTMAAEQGAQFLENFERDCPQYYDADLVTEYIRESHDQGGIRVNWIDSTRTEWTKMELLPAGAHLPPGHTFDASCCRR